MPRALHDAFDLRDQAGVMVGERLEFVEQRLDPDRLDDHEENDAGDGCQPEVEPPAAWAEAERGVQPPTDKTRDQQAEQQAFAPVPKP